MTAERRARARARARATTTRLRLYARFTLADPMPRLCPDAVGSANVNGLPVSRNRMTPEIE